LSHIKMARAMPSWFGFLKIGADLAITFINAAKRYSSPEDSVRWLGNARKALAEIQEGLMRPDERGLSESEVLFLARRSTEIRLALGQFKS
jgi:hypothetical protein